GEVFIRVNSRGMRITSADRAIALMGALDVRAMAEEIRQRVGEGVFALDGIDSILMGFNLIAEAPTSDGDPPKLEAMARRWSKRIEKNEAEKQKFRDLWHRFQEAFFTAVNYVHRKFPVHDESYLPSANMLATLSVFFFHHRGQPSPAQARELRKWFWATGVGQRYSGRGYHQNLVADAQWFESLAHGAHKPFRLKEYLDPEGDIRSAEYSSHSAVTRAFFCLLAAQKPGYLENGEEIPLDHAVVGYSNSRHRHHIFPQAQLRRHFPPRVYNSLCNICFLVSLDNQAIGSRLPRNYLAFYRDEYPTTFRRVMRSHLVSTAPNAGVWELGIKNAFRRFRAERLKLICAEFEKQAGMKLFRTL
ncbi:MAG TPA: hypothetical protein PLL76_04890, partial [Thermoanaerobaculia bacterium]|nr:hypothetical protein [Thermoanaerobaculia bacterium]